MSFLGLIVFHFVTMACSSAKSTVSPFKGFPEALFEPFGQEGRLPVLRALYEFAHDPPAAGYRGETVPDS